MDLLSDLTPNQREAATHVDGPLLVLAGAGSGKTRVITRRVAYLLKQGIPADQIVALTFTNKAAGEMRERIFSLVPGARVWVGTFHGFCARLLRRYGSLVGIDAGFSIHDQNDRLRTIKDVVEELGGGDANLSPDKIETLISRAKNDLVGPDVWRKQAHDQRSRFLAKVYEAYQNRLRASSAVDFDDLLVHTVAIVKNHPDVRAELDLRYRYVLIDEYQDTNIAQYAIAKALSVDYPNICVTGDPDQSIYGWRGANLSNILEFEKDFPGCHVVRLDRNYRSTANIIAVADHLIKHNRKRIEKVLRTENPAGAPVELALYASEQDEAEGIAATIAAKVHEENYHYRDVAVFFRMTALTRSVEQALRAEGIPYQVVGGMAFYERMEIKDVLAYVTLLVNPKDDVAFGRVVNVPPRGLGDRSLELLREAAAAAGVSLLAMARRVQSVPGLRDRALSALRDFTAVLDSLVPALQCSASEVLKQVIERVKYREYIKTSSREAAEDRLANLDELLAAAAEFDESHQDAGILDFLAEVTLSSPLDRWDVDEGAVTLMTLHAAKGLEFPLVFIGALENGILPHSRSQDSEDQLEEERRLLFVGVTRAQRELRLSRCLVRSFRGQTQPTVGSPFLDELPAGPIVFRDHTGGARREPYASRTLRDYAWPPRLRSVSQPPILKTAAGLMGGGPFGSLPTQADLDSMCVGASILHPEYGLGVVKDLSGEGVGRRATIQFAFGPKRTFILAKAPLQILGRSGSGRSGSREPAP